MTAARARLAGLWSRSLDWLLLGRHAGYGFAMMRITYGLMALLTLVLYAPHFSYTFGAASRWGAPLTDVSSLNNYPWPLPFPFTNGGSDALLIAAVLLLAVVAALYTLGWRMRIISPAFVYLWLGFTTLNPVITNSGHYQTLRIMLILMLFADLSQRWSLDARRRAKLADRPTRPTAWTVPSWFGNLCNNTAVILVGFQLCVIYVVSALWKLQGSTWLSGVAVYYPLQLEELTLIPWLNDFVASTTPFVFIATWMSVWVQLLFPLMLLHRWTRRAGLVLITCMHAGIGVLLAIPFFSLVMIAADMIFVRERTWRRIDQKGRDVWQRIRSRATRGVSAEKTAERRAERVAERLAAGVK